jgi:hypothetical protein
MKLTMGDSSFASLELTTLISISPSLSISSSRGEAGEERTMMKRTRMRMRMAVGMGKKDEEVVAALVAPQTWGDEELAEQPWGCLDG